MSTSRTTRYHRGSLFTSLFIAAGLISSSAVAQDEQIEELVVTGSYINTGEASSSPLEVISGETLFEVPRSSLGDYFFADVTQNIANETALDEGTEQGRLDGARNNSIDLRGLGKENTLVLIDGQRTVEYAVVDGNGWRAVDINTAIPRIALARTEILLDGGSALYGTDAVAGVVNLIPDYSFEGIKLSFNTNRFGEALGKANDTLSLLWGANTDSTNIIAALEYTNRDRVTNIDTGTDSIVADYNELVANNDVGAGTLQFIAGTGRRDPSVVDALCGDAATLGVPAWNAGAVNGSTCNYYDDDPANRQQETTAFNFFFGAEHEFNDKLSSKFTAQTGRQDIASVQSWGSLWSYDSNGDTFAPNAVVGGIDVASPFVQYYATNFPASDFAQYAGAAYGTTTLYSPAFPAMNYLEETTSGHEVRTDRLSLSLDYEINDSWTASAYVSYGLSEVTAHRRDVIPANYLAALEGFGGPGCNAAAGEPGLNGCEYFNPFMSSALDGGFSTTNINGTPVSVNFANSPGLVNWVFPEDTREHRGELTTFQFLVSGMTGLELGGGEVGVALGIERREDTLSADFDSLLNSGAYANFKGVLTPDYSGTQTVDAVFGELALPFSDTLDVQVAGRMEDFGFVDTFNPKVGFNWRASDDLTVRGSYGTSFKAPTVYQRQATAFIDPGWMSVGDPSDADYVGGFGGGTSRALLNEIISPNANLDPQESTNWSLGFDWNISDNLSLGMSYVSIEFENVIYIPSPSDTIRLSVCNQGTTSVADPDTADGVHPHYIPVDGSATNTCFLLDPTAIPGGSTYADEVEIGRGGSNFRDNYFQGVYISPNNLAFQNVEALDIDLAWSMDTDYGMLSVRPKATILLTFDEKTDPNGATQDFVGKADTFGGGFSQYRVNVPVSLDMGDTRATLTGRYISELEPLGGQAFGAFTSFDFNYVWNVSDDFRTSFFVNNLTDEVPDNLAPAQFPRDGRKIGLQFEYTLGN